MRIFFWKGILRRRGRLQGGGDGDGDGERESVFVGGK